MTYTLQVLRTFEKSFRRLPAHIQKHLKEELWQLADNPNIGEPLRGRLRQSRSLHLNYHRTQYRVIYLVDEEAKAVVLQLIGTRENFYKQAERLR